MKKLRVVFFATPDFSVPSLDILFNHPHVELAYVISMPDRKAGRGQNLKSPEVIEFAKANKIPFFQTQNINKEEDFLSKLENENIDCFVVLAFAQFLGKRLLDLPKLGCFNIHTSLLPKYRGAAPIQYALLNGDKTSGVSIQKMVKKMDAGDLGHSFELPLRESETGGQLYTRLKFQAALSLNDFIYELLDGSAKFTAQDESNVSFAPTLKREDGYLDFKNSKMADIHNRVRALFPWPGTYCTFNNKRLKVFTVEPSLSSVDPGAVKSQGEILVGCLDGTLRLSEVQLEGKKRSTDTVLLNGIKGDIKINSEE